MTVDLAYADYGQAQDIIHQHYWWKALLVALYLNADPHNRGRLLEGFPTLDEEVRDARQGWEIQERRLLEEEADDSD